MDHKTYMVSTKLDEELSILTKIGLWETTFVKVKSRGIKIVDNDDDDGRYIPVNTTMSWATKRGLF